MKKRNIVAEQSAVLAFRTDKPAKILLISSLQTGRWVLPKGNLEDGLSPSESAEKEAYEEAGVRGQVSPKKIGQYYYSKAELKGGGLCRVEVYPMKVGELLKDWPENHLRRRKWMNLRAASEAVAEPSLKELILDYERKISGDAASKAG